MVFDFQPGDVMAFFANPGWIVSHTYTVYGALYSGSTSFLYEGSLRDKDISKCRNDLKSISVRVCHEVNLFILGFRVLLFTYFLLCYFLFSKVGCGTW